MPAYNDIYISFFMFTVDLQPNNPEYTAVIAAHMRKLLELGYEGFDLPIAPGETLDHAPEVESYERLRAALDEAGLSAVGLTTNVGATRTFDPSSMYGEQRSIALQYLKSRVDITKALRAGIMAGPIVMPYGVFPTTDSGQAIWSDQLQEYAAVRYRNAQPVIQELAEYAEKQGVKVAIEPVDHWETPGPNMVGEVMDFLGGVPSTQMGVCVDSAHVVLGSDGPAAYTGQMADALCKERLHYVHISAPDRGAVHDSWIPWKPFLDPIREGYKGPYLIEVFNAIPVFLSSLRLTRRKFWIPGEDQPEPGLPSAYDIAQKAIEALRAEV